MTAVFTSAQHRVLRNIGFLLLMSAGTTLAVLAGAGPIPALFLGAVSIATLVTILVAIEQRELAKPGGRSPTDREEFEFLALGVGVAAITGLFVCGVYALLVETERTGSTAGICCLVLIAAMASFAALAIFKKPSPHQSH